MDLSVTKVGNLQQDGNKGKYKNKDVIVLVDERPA